MGQDEQTNLSFWLAFSHCFQGRQLRKIFEYYGNGEEAWGANTQELQKLGFTPEAINKLAVKKQELNPEDLMKKLESDGIKLLLCTDQNYPELLSHTFDAPVLLFYRGVLPAKEEQPLAVVGTRRYTGYGQAVTTQLVRELTSGGLTIVSGLARGIDGLAHQTTLDSGGRTVAILGSGIGNKDIYPQEHTRLVNNIIDRGGLALSEYPPGTTPERHHFPERNRIIAGYSLGTLVIEAPEKSGALITAKISLEYNREVLAVPGAIFDINAVGPNNLIKLGAQTVTSAEDVFEALQLKRQTYTTITSNPVLSKEEEVLISVLKNQPQHIDIIKENSGFASTVLASTLTVLELRGLIKDVGGKNYIRIN